MRLQEEIPLEISAEELTITGMGSPLSCKLVTVNRMAELHQVVQQVAELDDQLLFTSMNMETEFALPDDSLLIMKYGYDPAEVIDQQQVVSNIDPLRRDLVWIRRENHVGSSNSATVYVAQENKVNGEVVDELVLVTIYPQTQQQP